MTAPQLLIEVMDFTPIETHLVEADGEDSRLVMRGIFQRSDVQNANKRIYPRRIWEKVTTDNKYVDRIKGRCMFGHLDHPSDGKTKLSECSHLVTGLELRPDGTVIGEAEILDTPHGRILKSLIESGAKVAVSSRGTGSVSQQTNQVQDDFSLETFDFVATPSTPGAYPQKLESPQRSYRKRYTESENEVVAENVISLSEAEEKLKTAKQFLVSISGKIENDPARKAELVSKLFEHEVTIGSLGLDKTDAAGQLASEVGRELKAVRTSLEESLKQYLNRDELSDLGGSTQMPVSTTNPEARVHILEHENTRLEKDVQTLEDALNESSENYGAALKIIEEMKTRLQQTAAVAEDAQNRLAAAEEIIEELYGNYQELQESQSSETLNEEQFLVREAAAVSIIEEQQRRLRTGEQLIEEFGDRLLAAEDLIEALLNKVNESIMEAALEQSLASLPESMQEHVAPFLCEASTVDEVNERFEQVMNLMEAAAPQQPRYQDYRQPLPTPAMRQQVGSPTGVQQLHESAAQVPPSSGVALAMRLDKIMSGRPINPGA